MIEKTYKIIAVRKDYVEIDIPAKSKEEAIEIVQEGSVDHYDDDFLGLEVDKDGVQTEEEENN